MCNAEKRREKWQKPIVKGSLSSSNSHEDKDFLRCMECKSSVFYAFPQNKVSSDSFAMKMFQINSKLAKSKYLWLLQHARISDTND